MSIQPRISESLMPLDAPRAVSIWRIARSLGQTIAAARFGTCSLPDTVANALREFFEQHHVALPAHLLADRPTDEAFDTLGAEITAMIKADDCYDSESLQAARAVSTALSRAFSSEHLNATGWIRGHVISQDAALGENVALTGRACPRCEVNPQTCGNWISATPRCLDTESCGWWHCY